MLETRECPVRNSLSHEYVYQQNFIDISGVDIEKPENNVQYFKNKDIEATIIGSWSSQEEIYQSLKYLEENGTAIIKIFDKVDNA